MFELLVVGLRLLCALPQVRQLVLELGYFRPVLCVFFQFVKQLFYFKFLLFVFVLQKLYLRYGVTVPTRVTLRSVA